MTNMSGHTPPPKLLGKVLNFSYDKHLRLTKLSTDDNPNYAWDDCRLISANNRVGSANNPTIISTELATKGYVLSWNFESGN